MGRSEALGRRFVHCKCDSFRFRHIKELGKRWTEFRICRGIYLQLAEWVVHER